MEDRRLEKVLTERSFMEVYCSFQPVSALRKGLDRMGAVSAASLQRLPSGTKVLICGLVIFFHTPPTRSGRRIIFATLEDETGLFDAVILPHVQERWGKAIYTSEILTMRGILLRQGKNGISTSIKASEIVTGLSGKMEDVASALGCSG